MSALAKRLLEFDAQYPGACDAPMELPAKEWAELVILARTEAEPDLLAELIEARAIAIALLGAMPPALQRKWPNIVARAKSLGLEAEESPAIEKASGGLRRCTRCGLTSARGEEKTIACGVFDPDGQGHDYQPVSP